MIYRHQLFIENYIKSGFNGKQAAILTGYKNKSPEQIASKLLAKDNIKQGLEKRLQELNKGKIDTDELIDTLKKEMRTAEKSGDRVRATEVLAKISGLLSDKPALQVAIFNDIRKDIPIDV